jgi:hypothetical protein
MSASTRRSMLSVYGAEAWHELRSGLRSPMVGLMFAGLMGYVFMMLTNADFLRNMGGADVPRNSSLAVYQITSGQAFWLIFVWAWVFAQVVARDQTARLTESVLTAPVSLRGLLLARYAGALVLACILGSSSSLALLLVPALGALGILPESAIGPTPTAVVAHAWLLFVLPTAMGLGAIYVMAALATRSTAGPFAAAALIILAWMAGMVVLRSADVHSDIATLIDASGFGEARHQSSSWTPTEKATASLRLTTPLLYNRALWTAAPLGLFAWVMARCRREALVLERARRPAARTEREVRTASSHAAIAAATRPSWLVATWHDARWQIARLMSGWSFVVAMLLWMSINTAAPFVHMLAHAEGPLVPRGQLLAPFLLDFCYLFSVFGIAGFVGALVRRDQQPGFVEIVDCTPAPLGVRVVASFMAASTVTLAFAFVPALSSWLVMALMIPESFDVHSPWLISGVIATPALLELCALTFAIHALVRSAGTAHALSMFAAFVAVVNHETSIITYPPAQIGIPAHVALSELTGIRPWLAAVGALDAFKLAMTALLGALGWLAYCRGTALTARTRWRAAWQRLQGGAGALAGAGLIVLAASAWLLHDRLVVRGGYRSELERERDDAEWERRFWQRAGPFTLTGGEVDATLDPDTGRARVSVRLHGVRASNGRLSGELPKATRTLSALVESTWQDVTTELDHFELELGACPASGCEVALELELADDGWGLESVPPWLHASGVWVRALDLVPRLGLDADRRLRAPVLRGSHALPERPPSKDAAAWASAIGVAPAGQWRWSIRVTEPGEHTGLEGEAKGPLDFAAAWLPAGTHPGDPFHGLLVWHGPTRGQVAQEIAEDVQAMRACASARTGLPIDVDAVLQAPRALGAPALHGRVLWLPEQDGWDVGSSGVGRTKRRAAITQALAASALARAAELRNEPGSRWITAGLGGSIGLTCLEELAGTDAWMAWMTRKSEHVAEALGALEAPVVSLAEDGPANWVNEYAPLATSAWLRSLSVDAGATIIRSLLERVRAGRSVPEAMARAIGPEQQAALLGAPSASDVAVIADGSGLLVRGSRSRWVQGGWRPAPEEALTVAQHFEHGEARLSPLPLRPSPGARFTVFDAAPSFERSPLDNAWPRVSMPR